jgi:hypothetical protein
MTNQPPEIGSSNLSSLMGSLVLSMIENIHICSINDTQNLLRLKNLPLIYFLLENESVPCD